jgi:potassium efflux system protein
VLKEPAPSVLYIGFGDSSLNLVARCFVGDMAHRMPTTSDLHGAIDRAFREAGVVIAFPQSDMHLDAVGPIRIAIDDPEKPASGGRDAASTSAGKHSHE